MKFVLQVHGRPAPLNLFNNESLFLFLQDPNSNRIAQWLNKTIDGGILDFSHPTILEAVQGTYKITASTNKGEKVSHTFKIKEYGELQAPRISVPNENSN